MRGEQQLADAEHPHPAVGVEQLLGRSRAARISLRDSRTSSGDRDGASNSTRWPRAASSRETSAANVPTSLRILEGMRRDLGDGEALCHFGAAY